MLNSQLVLADCRYQYVHFSPPTNCREHQDSPAVKLSSNTYSYYDGPLAGAVHTMLFKMYTHWEENYLVCVAGSQMPSLFIFLPHVFLAANYSATDTIYTSVFSSLRTILLSFILYITFILFKILSYIKLYIGRCSR